MSFWASTPDVVLSSSKNIIIQFELFDILTSPWRFGIRKPVGLVEHCPPNWTSDDSDLSRTEWDKRHAITGFMRAREPSD